jgi:hypothetical protein
VTFDTPEVVLQARLSQDLAPAVRVAWQTLHLVELSVRATEETATRVVAAQVAGLIALWTQLAQFEDGPPEVLAWAAWGILLVSIVGLGVVITPRRVNRFWTALSDSAPTSNSQLDEAGELELIGNLAGLLRQQRTRIQWLLQLSIALGVSALVVAGLAYIVEKAFYGP